MVSIIFPMKFKFFNVLDERPEGLWDDELWIDVHHEEEVSTDEEWGHISVDVLEVHEGMVIIAPLAWVSRNHIDVNLVRNVLTISGHRLQPDVYKQTKEIHVQECFFWPFQRSVILPENLALNHIRATIEKNMMIITVPRLIVDKQNIKVENIEDIDE